MKDDDRISRQAQIAAYVAIVVVGMWAIATVVSLITNDFQVLAIVTPVALVVVGFLFGYRNGIRGRS